MKATHIIMRWLWSRGVLVWLGVSLFSVRCRVTFSILSVFGRVAPLWVARFVASPGLTCQAAVAHLTFRLCFTADNQTLCVVWWLRQSFNAPSAAIYTFLSSLQIDWLGRCTTTPPQNRQPHDINHICNLYLINPFQNPCHVHPVTKGDVCCVF